MSNNHTVTRSELKLQAKQHAGLQKGSDQKKLRCQYYFTHESWFAINVCQRIINIQICQKIVRLHRKAEPEAAMESEASHCGHSDCDDNVPCQME